MCHIYAQRATHRDVITVTATAPATDKISLVQGGAAVTWCDYVQQLIWFELNLPRRVWCVLSLESSRENVDTYKIESCG